ENPQPVRIDHANFNAIDAAPPEALARLKKLSAFFAHASVGRNIVQGLETLGKQNPARYCLRVEEAGETPPPNLESGVVYEFPRGNPGWPDKVRKFEQYLRNGWSSKKVPVAINKLCFIDEDANLKVYALATASLEKRYPDKIFVYVTMPVMSSNDAANRRRQT